MLTKSDFRMGNKWNISFRLLKIVPSYSTMQKVNEHNAQARVSADRELNEWKKEWLNQKVALTTINNKVGRVTKIELVESNLSIDFAVTVTWYEAGKKPYTKIGSPTVLYSVDKYLKYMKDTHDELLAMSRLEETYYDAP